MGEREVRIAVLATRQFGVFTGSQAVEAGFPRRTIHQRVADGTWARLLGDTYAVAGTPGGWEQQTMAALLACGPAAAVARSSAATVWGLGPAAPPTPEIVVPANRRPRVRGVVLFRSHRWGRLEVVRRGPWTVTSTYRTLLDLGAVFARDPLEDALDTAHRQGLRLRALASYLARPGHDRLPGVHLLRELVALRDPDNPMESVAETKAYRVLRQAGIAPPERQYVIETRLGPKRVDFAYPEQRVALEVDGYRYHGGRRSFDDDRARAIAIQEAGWTLRQITTRMLDDPRELIWVVATALDMEPTGWRSRR